MIKTLPRLNYYGIEFTFIIDFPIMIYTLPLCMIYVQSLFDHREFYYYTLPVEFTIINFQYYYDVLFSLRYKLVYGIVFITGKLRILQRISS